MKLSKSLNYKITFSFFAILILSISYHLIFAYKIIPGVKIGSVKVGGMSYAKAKEVLGNYEKNIDKTLSLNYENKKYDIKTEGINLQYNWDASVSRAYEVGRTGNILVDTKDKIAGLIKPIYLPAFYDYDEDLFHSRFAQIKGEINNEAYDATFVIGAPGQLESIESVEGKKVNDDGLFKVIINAVERVNYQGKELPVERITPKINKRDIDPLIERAKKIVFNNITITYNKKQWKLDDKQMLDFLTFLKQDETVDIILNSPKFEAFIETIANEVNMPPRGKVTQLDGNKVAKFEITQNGKELDAKKFTKAFKEAYFFSSKTVDLVLKDISGPADKERYGIFSLLGEGRSKFEGSSNARIHNLSLASERANGVLVPPNGIFSLNASIGEISGRTGYDSALIISGGRTVLGEGGGVCQTSTTVFRAALNAGLPIVMRYPHAYRVHYYEEDSKPGFDASIYQPTLDFQFKNDTPNYVLIQSSVDVPNVALNFKIYGTPDGRSVELTEPIITNQTPPPAPLYIDDPNLKKGITIQSDWATWGANVSFSRTVKRGGEILHTETFNTRYQPWRAVFQVGTKE